MRSREVSLGRAGRGGARAGETPMDNDASGGRACKGSQWREANRRFQLQTAPQPGVMPTPLAAPHGQYAMVWPFPTPPRALSRQCLIRGLRGLEQRRSDPKHLCLWIWPLQESGRPWRWALTARLRSLQEKGKIMTRITPFPTDQESQRTISASAQQLLEEYLIKNIERCAWLVASGPPVSLQCSGVWLLLPVGVARALVDALVTPRPKHAGVLIVPLQETPAAVDLDNKSIVFEFFRERTTHGSCPAGSKCLQLKSTSVRVRTVTRVLVCGRGSGTLPQPLDVARPMCPVCPLQLTNPCFTRRSPRGIVLHEQHTCACYTHHHSTGSACCATKLHTDPIPVILHTAF